MDNIVTKLQLPNSSGNSSSAPQIYDYYRTGGFQFAFELMNIPEDAAKIAINMTCRNNYVPNVIDLNNVDVHPKFTAIKVCKVQFQNISTSYENEVQAELYYLNSSSEIISDRAIVVFKSEYKHTEIIRVKDYNINIEENSEWNGDTQSYETVNSIVLKGYPNSYDGNFSKMYLINSNNSIYDKVSDKNMKIMFKNMTLKLPYPSDDFATAEYLNGKDVVVLEVVCGSDGYYYSQDELRIVE